MGWHRKIATNPSYTPSVATILPMIIRFVIRPSISTEYLSRALEHDQMFIVHRSSAMSQDNSDLEPTATGMTESTCQWVLQVVVM